MSNPRFKRFSVASRRTGFWTTDAGEMILAALFVPSMFYILLACYELGLARAASGR